MSHNQPQTGSGISKFGKSVLRVPSLIFRSSTNAHRFFYFMNGKVCSFLTSEKDFLTNLASLFGSLNAVFALPQSTIIKSAALSLALLPLLASSTAQALPVPTGGLGTSVQSINTAGNTMTVTTNGPRAIQNYSSFNVNAGQTVNFNLPNAASAILNRVTIGNPSSIMGSINSNGQVFITNPSGILFGSNSNINVGSLFATTLNITNANFLNNNLIFTRNAGDPRASVVNQGEINVGTGGFVILAGNSVSNSGVITAPNGSINLAVGEQVTAVINGVGVTVTVDDSLKQKVAGVNDAISNFGVLDASVIKAQAKLASAFYTNAVNNTGIIEATSIVGKPGSIEIVASSDTNTGGIITNTGRFAANSSATNTTAGTVTVTGDSVNADSTGLLSYNGDLYRKGFLAESQQANGQGGTVSITGRNGVTLTDALVTAEGTGTNGKGGTVNLTSNAGSISLNNTDVIASGRGTGQAGTINATSATGGISLTNGSNFTASGRSGAVNVTATSGAFNLSGTSEISVDNASGQAGNVTIASNNLDVDGTISGVGSNNANGGNFKVTTADLVLGGVNTDFALTNNSLAGFRNLEFNSTTALNVAANLNTTNLTGNTTTNLTLNANSDNVGVGVLTGNGTITAGTGNITMTGTGITLNNAVTTAGNVSLSTNAGSNGSIATAAVNGATITEVANGSGNITTSGANRLTGTDVNLTSGTGNITASTAATNLTANTAGTGAVTISELNGVSLGNSSAGGSFSLSNTTGNIAVDGTINAAGAVTDTRDVILTANGNLTGTGNIRGNDVILTSTLGTITSKTSADTLAVNGVGAVQINETDNVSLKSSGSTSSTFVVESPGTITVDGTINGIGVITAARDVAIYGDTGVNGAGVIKANDLFLKAINPAGTAGGSIDSQTAADTVKAYAFNSVKITEADAITVNTVDAYNGAITITNGTGDITIGGPINLPVTTSIPHDVTIISAGSILNGGAGTIKGNDLLLTAKNGSISAVTTGDTLNLNATTSVNVVETDNATLVGLNNASNGAFNLTSTNGSLDIFGSINETGAINANRDVNVTAKNNVLGEGVISGNDVVLKATTGSINSLTAADTLAANANTSVHISEANNVSLKDSGSATSTFVVETPGIITVDGTINGTGAITDARDVAIYGDAGVNGAGVIKANDLFLKAINPAGTAGGSIDSQTAADTVKAYAFNSVKITEADAITVNTVDAYNGAITITNGTGDITIGGPINLPVTTSIPHDVTIISAGSILNGGAGTIKGNDLLLTAKNGSISAVTTGDTLNLNATTSVNVVETDNATLVGLNNASNGAFNLTSTNGSLDIFGSINETGAINANRDVNVTAKNNVLGEGVIRGNDVVLTATTGSVNSLTAADTLNSNGTSVNITEADDVSIVGANNGSTGAYNVSSTAGSIAVTGTINGTGAITAARDVNLTANNNITGAGLIKGDDTVLKATTGSVTATTATNTLNSNAATSSTVTEADDVSLVGANNASNGAFSVTSTAGSIAITGTINGTGAITGARDVNLTAQNNITGNGLIKADDTVLKATTGSVTANTATGTLNSNAGTSSTVTEADNVTVVGSNNASNGAYNLTSAAGTITVTGNINDVGAVNANRDVNLTANQSINGAGVVKGNDVVLKATNGSIASNTAADTLAANANTTVLVNEADNVDLRASSANQQFTLNSAAGSINVVGAVNGSGAITNARNVTLNAQNNITGNALISANTTTLNATTGSVTATTRTNNLNTTAAGSATVNEFDNVNLLTSEVGGLYTVNSSFGAINVAQNMNVVGPITPSRDVTLNSLTGISGAGRINADDLILTTLGNANVLTNVNTVASQTGGTLTVNELNGITIKDSNAGGKYTVNTAAGDITVQGSINGTGPIIGTRDVTLNSFGSVNGAGLINADDTVLNAQTGSINSRTATNTLNANAATSSTVVEANNVSLIGANNALDGAFNLTSTAGSIAVTGTVNGTGAITASRDVNLTAQNNITGNGLIKGDDTVLKATTGSITANLATNTLNANAGTFATLKEADDVQLVGASNASNGTFKLTSAAGSIDVNGTINGTGAINANRDVNLTAQNNITGNGLISGDDTVLTATTGSITANLATNTLNANAATFATMTEADDVVLVGSSNATDGTFDLTSTAGSINVTGDVNGTGAITASRDVNLTAQNNIVGTGVVNADQANLLAINGSIAQAVPAGGRFATTANELTLNAGTDVRVQNSQSALLHQSSAGFVFDLAVAGDLISDGTVTGFDTSLQADGFMFLGADVSADRGAGTLSLAAVGDIDTLPGVVLHGKNTVFTSNANVGSLGRIELDTDNLAAQVDGNVTLNDTDGVNVLDSNVGGLFDLSSTASGINVLGTVNGTNTPGDILFVAFSTLAGPGLINGDNIQLVSTNGSINSLVNANTLSSSSAGASNITEIDNVVVNESSAGGLFLLSALGGSVTVNGPINGQSILLQTLGNNGNLYINNSLNAQNNITLAANGSGTVATGLGARLNANSANLISESGNILASTNVGFLQGSTNGLLNVSQTGAITLGNLRGASGVTVTNASGNISLSGLTSGQTVDLTANGGNILNVGGPGTRLQANTRGSLTASGFIGTQGSPVTVNLTNGPLIIAAFGQNTDGVSAAIDGTVSPSNGLTLGNIPPGAVLFNGGNVFSTGLISERFGAGPVLAQLQSNEANRTLAGILSEGGLTNTEATIINNLEDYIPQAFNLLLQEQESPQEDQSKKQQPVAPEAPKP